MCVYLPMAVLVLAIAIFDYDLVVKLQSLSLDGLNLFEADFKIVKQ